MDAAVVAAVPRSWGKDERLGRSRGTVRVDDDWGAGEVPENVVVDPGERDQVPVTFSFEVRGLCTPV